MEYQPKDELERLATEVLEFLRPQKLPIWQVKEILKYAASQLEWMELK